MPNYYKNKRKKNKRISTSKEDGQMSAEVSNNFQDLSLEDSASSKYRIAVSDIMGRYLVANKPLQAGELIIQQQPLVIGPCAESQSICIACYYEQPSYKCPNCAWPLCNPRCKGINKKQGHSKFECDALKINQVASTSAIEAADFECLTVLRCLLLRDIREDDWKKLMEMESHNNIRKNMPTLWDRNQKIIVERIRKKWKFDCFDEDLIHTICGILEVNSFEVGSGATRARALFPEAFFMSHDCCPNTTHTDDPNDNHAISVRVTKNMNEGEIISLSYSYTLMGTLKRRQHLLDSKFFQCACKRCSDPTELGTFASGLICAKCTNGIVLSADPLSQNSNWCCSSCSYNITGKHVFALLSSLFDEMETVNHNEAEGFETFLLKYRNVLHKNHYLNLSAKHSLCQIYGRTEKHLLHEMSDSELFRKEQYCRDLLSVVDILEPGLSRLRGVIMYELHAPLMLQATRLFEKNQISKHEVKKKLKEVIKLLKESEIILSFEPEGTPEADMGAAAKDALSRMTTFY